MEVEFADGGKGYRRVARFYRNGKMSYDFVISASEKFKRISASKKREIVEGCNESVWVSIVEDEQRGRAVVEEWVGQRDAVSGNMSSKRVVYKNVNLDVAHLFVSECSVNCFVIKNGSEVVSQLVEKIIDFVRQQANKPEKT